MKLGTGFQMKKNILVVNSGWMDHLYYGRPFNRFGNVTDELALIDRNPESIRCAVFTGGSDVDPSMYGHKKLPLTGSDIKRDHHEKAVFDKLLKNDIPMFGICRGSQFLCAMAGGTLVQHMFHPSRHDLRILRDGREELSGDEQRVIAVNSTHHQMQVPPEGAEVIAVAEPRMSYTYDYAGEKPDFKPEYEYEVVYYPNIKALGAQYHPEVMPEESEGFLYYQELLEHFMDEQS